MYKTFIGSILGALTAVLVLSTFIYEQQVQIKELQTQLEATIAEKNAIEKSKESISTRLEYETKVFEAFIDQFLKMCQEKRVMKLKEGQYRCYRTYDM